MRLLDDRLNMDDGFNDYEWMKACRKHMIDTFCLSPKLQRQHENMDAHTMIMHVKDLFEQTSRSERHETFKKLFHYKMTEGSSVNIIF